MTSPLLAESAVAHPALASDLELAGLLRSPESLPLHLERERRRVAGLLEGDGWGVSSPAGLALVRPLPWDSAHFGFSCADLARFYLTAPAAASPDELDALVGGVLEGCVQRGVRLLSARLPAGWIPLVQGLERGGFRLVDTSVELGALLPLAPQPAPPGIAVRDPAPADRPALEQVAARFTGNRFHRDRRIPLDKAEGVYRAWAASALAGRHGKLVLAEAEGQVAGLATYHPLDEGMAVGQIALVAVHPGFRGRRVLDALVDGSQQRLGGRALVTSTQVSNSAALRAFGRHGLLPVGARHIFHRWFDDAQ